MTGVANRSARCGRSHCGRHPGCFLSTSAARASLVVSDDRKVAQPVAHRIGVRVATRKEAFGWPSRGLLDDLACVADPDLTNNRVTSETKVRKP